MKRLLLAVGLVLMTAGSAMAHGHFSYDISIGFPLYFFPWYPPARVVHPAYAPPPFTSTYYGPNRFFYAPPQVYRARNGARTVVEHIYYDGRLVERRVKSYPPNWAGYR